MVSFRELTDNVLDKCMDSFGEDMTYLPQGIEADGYMVRAIFDNNYQEIDIETQEAISANQSIVSVNLNRIRNNRVIKGDIFNFRNTSYRAIDSREDGQGGAMVLVHKVECDTTTDLRES